MEGDDKMTLSDDQKKRLTMLLGECWHGPFVTNYGHDCVDQICKKCWSAPEELKYPKNRTFTTWQDLGDLKERLEEKGMWEKFYNYCAALHQDENTSDKRSVVRFTVWLLNPATFIPMVAEFLEAQNERD